MVTMKQIDDARANATAWVSALQLDPREINVAALATARANVEALLHEWWAQSCKEVEAPLSTEVDTYVVQPGDTLSQLAERFDTTTEALAEMNGIEDPNIIVAGERLHLPPAWKKRCARLGAEVARLTREANLRRENIVAVRLELRAGTDEATIDAVKRLKTACRSAEDEGAQLRAALAQASTANLSMLGRAREACGAKEGAVPSAPNDWVDELIGLLRVMRGQRDDAEGWAEKADARLMRERREHADKIKALEVDVKNIDEVNRKIHADRVRLATAIRDALERLNSPGVAYGQAIEILNSALAQHEKIGPCGVVSSDVRVTQFLTGIRARLDKLLDAEWMSSGGVAEIKKIVDSITFVIGGQKTTTGAMTDSVGSVQDLPRVEPVPLGVLRSICACGAHLLPPSGYVDDHRGHHKAKRCNLTFTRGQLPLSPLVEKTIQQMIDRAIEMLSMSVDDRIKRAIYMYATDPKSTFVGHLRTK
jgi:LysM repeat protein